MKLEGVLAKKYLKLQYFSEFWGLQTSDMGTVSFTKYMSEFAESFHLNSARIELEDGVNLINVGQVAIYLSQNTISSILFYIFFVSFNSWCILNDTDNFIIFLGSVISIN